MASISVNTESLEQTLNSFVSAHDALGQTVSSMSSALTACEWQSPAAEDFRKDWTDEYQPSLSRILTAIEQFNTEMRNQLARYNANEGIS